MSNPTQKNKITALKDYLGDLVLFKYKGKLRKFWLAAITLPSGTFKAEAFKDIEYEGLQYHFRLNHEDYATNTKRDWEGFWTDQIDKLIIPTTNDTTTRND